jgi:hypothetical protein
MEARIIPNRYGCGAAMKPIETTHLFKKDPHPSFT